MVTDGGDRDERGRPVVVGDGGRSLLTRVFGSLSHPRRRCVLYYLRECDQAEAEDLALAVIAWEQGIPKENISTEDRKDVQAELRHIHLPKLEDYRLVEYDSRSGTVSYSYPPEILDDIIDFAMKVEEPPCP